MVARSVAFFVILVSAFGYVGCEDLACTTVCTTKYGSCIDKPAESVSGAVCDARYTECVRSCEP